MTTYPHPACMEPDGGEGPCAGYKSLAAENDRLRQALLDVMNPMGWLQRRADAEGATLNRFAHEIANNMGTVREIARTALG